MNTLLTLRNPLGFAGLTNGAIIIYKKALSLYIKTNKRPLLGLSKPLSRTLCETRDPVISSVSQGLFQHDKRHI